MTRTTALCLLVALAIGLGVGAWWGGKDAEAVGAHDRHVAAEREAIRKELNAEKDARAKAEYLLGVQKEATRKAEKGLNLAQDAAAVARERLAALKASPPLPLDAVALNLGRLGYRPTMVSGLIAFDEKDANGLYHAVIERQGCMEALYAEREVSVKADGVIVTLRSQIATLEGQVASWEASGAAYERGKEVLDADRDYWKLEAERASRRVWLWKAVAVGAVGLAGYAAAN